MNNDRILRLPEVINLVALSASSIARLSRAGKFPERLRLSTNAVGWRHSEVAAWIEARQSQPAKRLGP